MFNPIFYTLNTFEGIFWIALSFVVAFYIIQDIPRIYRFLGIYTALTLLIFGVSDFIESFVIGYPNAQEWLFIFKALSVLTLSLSIMWYIKIKKTILSQYQNDI